MKTLSLKHAISKGIYLLDDIEEFCSEKKDCLKTIWDKMTKTVESI